MSGKGSFKYNFNRKKMTMRALTFSLQQNNFVHLHMLTFHVTGNCEVVRCENCEGRNL